MRTFSILLLRTAGARVGHDVDRLEAAARLIQLAHLAEHLVGDLLRDFRPHRDDLVVALAVGDRTFEILLLDLDDLVARVLLQLLLVGRNDQVVDANRQPRPRRIGEPESSQRAAEGLTPD
jgi:hypothetical protein